MSESTEKFDFLDECPENQRVPGQMFAIISIVESQDKTKCALKLKGCFNTEEKAKEKIKKIHDEDKRYNLYVVDMYKWLLLPPDIENIGDQEYQEGMLNDIIKGHAEQTENATKVFEERREQLRSGSTLESLEENINTQKEIN